MDKRVALVTGSSRGIGSAIAIELAKQGCDIVITCHSNAQKAAETAEKCKEFGAETLVLTGDCAEKDICQNWVDSTIEKFGKIDVLVNNAGQTKDMLIMRMTDSQFDDVVHTNLYSAFYLCRAVTKPMMKAKKGRIINISSVAGVHGNAGQVNYSASKAGLIGLTKSLSKELGSRNITVNAVAPGIIQTDMTESLPDDVKSSMLSRISLGRTGKAEEIASLVAFLASDSASYITGQVILADGGMAL